MQGECFLNSDTVRDLAHSKSRAHIAFAPSDDNTLKYLYPFLVALNDANMHSYSVTGPKVRHIITHLLSVNSFDNITAHTLLFSDCCFSDGCLQITLNKIFPCNQYCQNL